MQAKKYTGVCVSIGTHGMWKVTQSDAGFYIIFKPVVEVWISCKICLQFTHEERSKIVNTWNLAHLRVFQSTHRV